MSYYPGYEDVVEQRPLDWKGVARFERPDPGRVLPPSAHRFAAPPPPDPADAKRSIATFGETVANRQAAGLRMPAAKRSRDHGPALSIGAFPKGKRGVVAQRRSKADCPHEEGWIRNGKGKKPGTIRVQCRACGLNRQALKGEALKSKGATA